MLFTSACSGTYHAYYQTLKLALEDKKDITRTLQHVKQSTTDLIAARLGARPSAIMALAYLENGKHKWISNDNAMFIMEKGRLIQTIGLNKNLLYMSNTENDPLKTLPSLPQEIDSTKVWSYNIDLSDDEYGYPINSQFSQRSQDTLTVFDKNLETIMYVETSTYLAPSNYVQLNKTWNNYYWYTTNGSLIKSIQKYSPMAEPVEIIYLSRIARII